MKNNQQDEVLTVSVFRTMFTDMFPVMFAECIKPFEGKMIQGFEMLDRKIDFVDKSSEERDRALSEKIDRIAAESEHRDRALSAQIQHLAFTKADWNEIT